MIGTILTKPVKGSTYAETAVWCNNNHATIEDKGDYYEVVALPEPTAEEIAEQELQQKKADRAEAVSKITVEVDGMVFDGDEKSQSRMSEAIITAMTIGVKQFNANKKIMYESGEIEDDSPITYEELTTQWVLADNSVEIVTIGQLEQALGLAKMKLSELWIKPYQD